MFEKLLRDRKSSGTKYKYPVYRSDDRPRRLTPTMLEKMDADQLWEELKKLCKIEQVIESDFSGKE